MKLGLNGQTYASSVDVYALAGAQDTAVSVAVPKFFSGTRSKFDIALTTVVRSLMMVVYGSLGLHKACSG